MDNSVARFISSEQVSDLLVEHHSVAQAMHGLAVAIADAAEVIANALIMGGKVMLCGNGGSAADAQHLAGELVGRFLKERRALPAMALNANSSVLTALANDYGVEQIFARQVEAYAGPHDVLVALSTSGQSSNVLAAVHAARHKNIKVVGMTGASGGALLGLCDVSICIPSPCVPRIQEMHILVGHIICQMVEGALC